MPKPSVFVQKWIRSLAVIIFSVFWAWSVFINFNAPTKPNQSMNLIYPVQEHGVYYVTPLEGYLYDCFTVLAFFLLGYSFYLSFGPQILSLLTKGHRGDGQHDD